MRTLKYKMLKSNNGCKQPGDNSDQILFRTFAQHYSLERQPRRLRLKTRKPIRFRETQTVSPETNNPQEFKILCATIQNCQATSIDRNVSFGLPCIHVAVNNGLIVGVANTFWRERRSGLYPNPNRPESLEDLALNSPWELQLGPSLQNGIFDATNRYDPLATCLASRIERKIINASPHVTTQSYLVPFTDLFHITVLEAEKLNQQLKRVETVDKSAVPFSGSLENLGQSIFSCSLVYRKKIWWINLFSKEVVANRHGISYNGESYLPKEERDIFILKKLVDAGTNVLVTVYAAPYIGKSLYWVHEQRMIKIVPRNRRTLKVRYINPSEITKQSF